MPRIDKDLAWREEVIQRLTRVEEGLVPRDEIVAMRASFDTFQKQLGGNGQPGLCRDHTTAIEGLNQRVGMVERRQAWWSGAAAAFGALSALLMRIVGK